MSTPAPSHARLQSLREMVAGWSARYDRGLMRPPDAHASADPATTAPWRVWCLSGAGDGRAPFWRPWVAPQVPRRFVMASADQPGGPWVDALMCELDGTRRLQAARGRLARLWLRLTVKLVDMAWWRPRPADHPWDAGHLDDAPATRRQLPLFLPRRPTLLVVRSPDPAFLARCAQTLSVRQAAFRHPVRLLVLGNGRHERQG